MRAKAAKDGMTLRVIAGTHSVLLAMDLDGPHRKDCLGFSIERTNLHTGERRWLPNMVNFKEDENKTSLTTARAPLQAFRWGDYTTDPKTRYRYRAVPRKGTPAAIIATGLAAEAKDGGDLLTGGVSVEITTEDTGSPETAVFFNRGAAASKAYTEKFGDTDPRNNPEAQVWLSRGLERALLDFLNQAKNGSFALHACIYEFQKENLLEALGAAKARKAEVQVVYHARTKAPSDHSDDFDERAAAGAAKNDHKEAKGDKTFSANTKAIQKTGLDKQLGRVLFPRASNPQGAIMHDKFVVLLKDGHPTAVWTGSTNWTEGALYGQLNVGHALYDEKTAGLYEKCFQLLKGDPNAATTKRELGKLTKPPASRDDIPHGVTVIFSPQSDLKMIDLYADVCAKATLLLVSAPFLLHESIREILDRPSNGALRYVMADKEGAFGKKGTIKLYNGTSDPGRVAAVATMLKNKLNDYQGRLLEGRESFHHAGVHIHTKIILADPFGFDPILITGSANFSNNSTKTNDSNSLIVRGSTAVADIYGSEFMRMFQHYWFRFKEKGDVKHPVDRVIKLDETADWQKPFFDPNTTNCRDRIAFIGA